jgi:hypothetical protein
VSTTYCYQSESVQIFSRGGVVFYVLLRFLLFLEIRWFCEEEQHE